MFFLVKFIFARLIPLRFWMYGLYLIFLTGCSTYVGDFWTGFLTFVIGFPVWIVVGIFCVASEIKALRQEYVNQGTGKVLDSLLDEKNRADILSTVSKVANSHGRSKPQAGTK